MLAPIEVEKSFIDGFLESGEVSGPITPALIFNEVLWVDDVFKGILVFKDTSLLFT